MNQDNFDRELDENRKAYEKLRDQIKRDHAGLYVALAFGKVVAVSPDFHEAQSIVDSMKPAPEHAVIFHANDEPAWDIVDSLSNEYL